MRIKLSVKNEKKETKRLKLKTNTKTKLDTSITDPKTNTKTFNWISIKDEMPPDSQEIILTYDPRWDSYDATPALVCLHFMLWNIEHIKDFYWMRIEKP